MAELLQSVRAILRRKQVEAETGLSRSTLYERMKSQTFPPAIKLGAGRSVGWRRGDVDEWLRDPSGYRAPGA
jgi:prophage regulatory protein